MNRKGFTLLETMLAMLIISSGILLLSNSWSGSFMRIRKTQVNVEAAALLERKMVEVEMEYQDKPLESIPEEKADDFGSEYPQYSWRMEAKEFELPNIASALTAESGGSDELTMTIMRTMQEHLAKSIKEVKVVVIYKGGKKAREISATQYFVNYDRPIQMPAMGMGGM